MGQSQMVPHADGSWPRGTSDGQATGARDLRQHSLLAEYFPAGHVDYLMELLFHPQMVALQRRLLRLDAAEEELGDLLHAITSLARHLGVSAEVAAISAAAKFERRFRQVESAVRERRVEQTVEAMEAEWQRVKCAE